MAVCIDRSVIVSAGFWMADCVFHCCQCRTTRWCFLRSLRFWRTSTMGWTWHRYLFQKDFLAFLRSTPIFPISPNRSIRFDNWKCSCWGFYFEWKPCFMLWNGDGYYRAQELVLKFELLFSSYYIYNSVLNFPVFVCNGKKTHHNSHFLHDVIHVFDSGCD